MSLGWILSVLAFWIVFTMFLAGRGYWKYWRLTIVGTVLFTIVGFFSLIVISDDPGGAGLMGIGLLLFVSFSAILFACLMGLIMNFGFQSSPISKNKKEN